ncbi:hypothetical protein BBJ28_00008588 [Nothophytophthora sp. Chile5]|nr:hypothetical protein BBJ28_00008588 [Nothophytophthora sp. Chile5]
MEATTSAAPPSFYRRAPQRPVALDEFEELGLARLQLLALVAGWDVGRAQQLTEELGAFKRITEDADADTLSHYALRLAFCRSHREWDWLIGVEAKLLAFRLGSLPSGAAVRLLANEGVKYEPVHAENAAQATQEGHERSRIRYRVSFHEVSALVRQRRVVVRRGCCLIPNHEMNCVALHHFKRSLKQQLGDLRCAIPALGPDVARLTPILDGFIAKAHSLVGSSGSRSMTRPRLEVTEMDQAAEKHFPLCMKQLHHKLRENHHLKYDGRLQYRLFLKGVGFSVYETLQFFRAEFVKKISPAKFDKEYAYHIRHSYGLEGSRRDYAPLSCEQIIHGSTPSHGQYHGCPFKHWGRAALQDELRRHGVSLQSAMEIARQAAGGEFQGACRAFFEASHPASASYAHLTANAPHSAGLGQLALHASSVAHPNEYLDASLQA